MTTLTTTTKTKGSAYMTFATLTLALCSCDKASVDSFSLLQEEKQFQQVSSYQPRKIDILWVIDNSGSMASSQTNLANNFSAFISRFISLNYDFHMGVTTTDAYLSDFGYGSSRSLLKDGAGSSHSGVFVMDRNTPNMTNVFITNITQGTGGSGDERAFSSFRATLANTGNAAFRRADAFLAVIIVSDEEDFSQNTINFNESYSNSQLYSVNYYKNYLDTLTNQTANGVKNYSVNTISILDAACRDFLNASSSGRKIGTRYIQLADSTSGTKGSLCSNFGDTLDIISGSILTLTSSFVLDREPIIESIVIKVDGSPIMQSAVNGWSYNPATMTISFNGNSVPREGSNISVSFDPKTIKQ